MKEHESIDIHGVRNSMSHVRMSVKVIFCLKFKKGVRSEIHEND